MIALKSDAALWASSSMPPCQSAPCGASIGQARWQNLASAMARGASAGTEQRKRCYHTDSACCTHRERQACCDGEGTGQTDDRAPILGEPRQSAATRLARAAAADCSTEALREVRAVRCTSAWTPRAC